MAFPRTVAGAAKRGWTVVYVPRREDLSWAGICNWIYSNVTGQFVADYRYKGDGDVAFERSEDASMVIMSLNGTALPDYRKLRSR